MPEKGSELSNLESIDNEILWNDEKLMYEEFKERIYIKHLYGSLFFGFTAHFQKMVSELNDNIKVLILRMDRVPYIDQSGLYALEDALFQLQKTGVHIIIVGLTGSAAKQNKLPAYYSKSCTRIAGV